MSLTTTISSNNNQTGERGRSMSLFQFFIIHFNLVSSSHLMGMMVDEMVDEMVNEMVDDEMVDHKNNYHLPSLIIKICLTTYHLISFSSHLIL